MNYLADRVRMTTATTGTGTITLGSAVSGYRTFASASVPNASIVTYTIEDGTAWEVGTGTYTSSGTTLSRTLISSNTGSLLSLTGSAQVFITAAAQDLTYYAPQTTYMLTGSGTYTTPVAGGVLPIRLEVEMIGGGSGGNGSGTTPGNGGAGGNTTFGASMTAGGAPTHASGTTAGAGGTSTGGDLNQTGCAGAAGLSGFTNAQGPQGGMGPYGGSQGSSGGGAGIAGLVNTGAGGGGAGDSGTASPGGSGGSGGYLEASLTGAAILTSFAWAVGAAGSAGAGGTGGAAGGAGGSGRIKVTAYWQ